MKLFRLIGTMTIVAAVAATMAVSASAATATYENNAVTVDTEAKAVETGYTVLISSALDNANPAEEQIYQLYQDDELGAIALPANLPAGKYYVTVGGIETGAENTSFVKGLETEATPGKTFTEGDDEDVATFTVNVDAPAGLTPYWYATIGGVPSKTREAAKWANIEGPVQLGLVYQGAKPIENVRLIWE